MRWYLGSSIFCEASPTIIQAWKKKIILFSYFISIYIKKLLPLIFISTLLMPFTPFCSFHDIIFDMKSTKLFSFLAPPLSIVQVSFAIWEDGSVVLWELLFTVVSPRGRRKEVFRMFWPFLYDRTTFTFHYWDKTRQSREARSWISSWQDNKLLYHLKLLGCWASWAGLGGELMSPSVSEILCLSTRLCSGSPPPSQS